MSRSGAGGPVRRVLVTGIGGQDGSYLAELLLERGDDVVGTTRGRDAGALWRIRHLQDRIAVRSLDLRDNRAVARLVAELQPDEIYHLAAASRVDRSWEHPMEALEGNAGATVHLMEAVRREAPTARLLLASSCEIFGRPDHAPQDEHTPVRPASPYGVSKAAAFWLGTNYRDTYGLHVASAILFNHESPRRSEAFLTRKVSMAVARIVEGRARSVTLGNLEGRRDWGFAGDYADAMVRMQQLESPRDLVIGTGSSHSVRDFCECAFRVVGLDYREYVVSDDALRRPVDATTFVADAREARRCLGWRPTVRLAELAKMMVDADLERLRRGELV